MVLIHARLSISNFVNLYRTLNIARNIVRNMHIECAWSGMRIHTMAYHTCTTGNIVCTCMYVCFSSSWCLWHMCERWLATGEMATTSIAFDDSIKLIDKPGSKSIAWNYFALEADTEGKVKDAETAVCRKCNKWVAAKNGNTSNLIAHLRTHHHGVYTEVTQAMKERVCVFKNEVSILF